MLEATTTMDQGNLLIDASTTEVIGYLNHILILCFLYYFVLRASKMYLPLNL